MTVVKDSTAWAIYVIAYVVGFAGLIYVAQTSPHSWPAVWLPFVFPVALVIVGSLAARADASSFRRVAETERMSLLGRRLARITHEPMTASTAISLTLFVPFFEWIYPGNVVSPTVRLLCLLWWLFCAAFSWLILPRLVGTQQSDRLSARS